MNRLLVVDDDPLIRKVHYQLLGSHFSIESVDNGRAALEHIEQHQPEVVLLDVALPDINGFEVARQLTERGALDDTAVIFVTGNIDADAQIEALNSGGDDLILKPLERESVLSKIDFLLEQKKHKLQMKSELAAAHQTAMEAMSSSSELGQAMRFVESSFSIFSIDKLVNEFSQTLNSLGLSNVVSVCNIDNPFYVSSLGVVKPVEQQLISLLRSKDRFFDFGQRTQINYPNVSVLLKNMPIGDFERYGRIKDMLPSMIGCVDARVADLSAQDTMFEQTVELIHSFDVIQMTMQSLTDSMGSNQKQAADRLHAMVSELEVFVQRLGLEEDQEQRVITYIDEAVEESLGLLDSADHIFSAFGNIISNLKLTIDKQSALVDKINSYREKQTPVVSDNVDLF